MWNYYEMLTNANKNQLRNIITFIREKTNKNYFLHIMHPQSIFPSCFKLVLNSIIDLLVVGLAGGRNRTAPFLRLYGTSFSLKKSHMNLDFVVTL